jgi:hypothetical protein
MSRNAIIQQILAIKDRFNELSPPMLAIEAYKKIANEMYEDAHTIALKKTCTGYYHCFAKEVEKLEKERFVKA